jgi:hypothetical protein
MRAALTAALFCFPILALAAPQITGKTLSRGKRPFSDNWSAIRQREAKNQARLQDEIRRGLRPPMGIPKVQPEEEEEEESTSLQPVKDTGPSTAPLLEPRFQLGRKTNVGMKLPQQLAGAGFKGDDMLEGSQASGFLFIPPDTQGAIGPNHFVEMTNATVSVFTRTGTKLTTASLDNFFTITVSGTTYPRNGSTDPRIVYDRRSGRWFACIIEIGASSAGSSNNIILAVSRGSDPVTSTWDKYIVPTAQGGATGNTKFNDYESLAVDDNGVYFGMSVFPKGGGSHARIVVTRKSPLIAASPSLGTVTDFDNLTGFYSTPQPANNFDAVAANGNAWFVAANDQVYANLNYRKLTWNAGTPTLDPSSTVLTTPAFTAPIDVPSLNASLDADVGDMRVMMAVIRNSRLWCCRHVAVNSTGGSTSADRTACEFFELNVSGATASLAQTGRVYDTAATNPRFYFYPGLAVSGQGHVVMAMSGAKSTEFIGAWTCGRYASDPTGTMGVPTLYKAGDAKYSVSFSGSPDRWGDYSYTSLDPNDDMSMWAIQEYARTPNGTQDLWSTWISKALSAAPTLNNPNASGMQGTSNYSLPLTGTGFYDPGTGFPNRLAVALNGGATNGISGYSVTYNSPASATVSFNIAANASVGTRDVVLTNPDGQSVTVTNGFTVTAATPNTAPAIIVPGPQSGTEDTNLPISGISIADADVAAGSLLTTLTVSNGTVSLGSTTGLSFVSGANNSSSMSFTATLVNTNNAIANLVYKGALNFNGTDTLSVTTDDQGNSGSGGALSDADSVAITVAAANDAPVLTAPASASGNEDASISIGAMSVSDVDLGSSSIQVSLSASNGSITLGSTAGLNFYSGANGTGALTVSGDLASVNNALTNVSYQGNANFSGSDTLSITASDLGATGSGGAKTDNKNISISLAAVNDTPTLTLPSGTGLNEDTSVTLTGALISDVDAGSANLQLSLSVSSGTIALNSTSGLSITPGANNSASMTLTGNLTSLNSAVGTLTYTPTANYNGADSLAANLSDLGNTGSGGAKLASGSVPLNIAAVNDAPVLTVPGVQGVLHDTVLPVNGVSVADIDLGPGELQVTLSASNGKLTLGSTAGLTFTVGDGTADPTMTFTGTVAAINNALAALTYQGNAGYSGADTISITATDQGFTGIGGTLQDSKNIPINVAVPVGVSRLFTE